MTSLDERHHKVYSNFKQMLHDHPFGGSSAVMYLALPDELHTHKIMGTRDNGKVSIVVYDLCQAGEEYNQVVDWLDVRDNNLTTLLSLLNYDFERFGYDIG